MQFSAPHNQETMLALFAVQLTEKKFFREAKEVVKVGSGLHASSKWKMGSDTVNRQM